MPRTRTAPGLSSAAPATVVVEGLGAGDRLLALLAEAGVTGLSAASDDGCTTLSGPCLRPLEPGAGVTPTLRLDARSYEGADRDWWAASRILRWRREVPDADRCASPGLDSVLDNRVWSHPETVARPAGALTPVAGVVVFKPGVLVLPQTLRALATRLAECGYRAARARVLSGAEIRAADLASHHYLPHVDLAERGVMSVHERARFLNLYDRPEFVARFGERAHDVPVLTARAVLDELNVPVAVLDGWSNDSTLRHGLDSGAVDGPNGIGDCLYVNVFQHPDHHGGRAFVVLNPHLPGVLDQLRDTTNQAVAVLVESCSRTPLAWDRMRREFCGVTDPERAVPGSLRGDARVGELPLRNVDGTPVRRTNNGVHLSNGAIEALQDAVTWFALPAAGTSVGAELGAAGLDPDRLLASAFVGLAGRRRAVQEVADGLPAARAALALRGGRLMRHSDEWDDERSRRAVDIAWRHTADLRDDPSVCALFLHGSVGRGRTADSTGLDLLVVYEGAEAPSKGPGPVVEGVEVRVSFVPAARARPAAAEPPGGAGGFGLVAALAGVVLWEREGEGRALREAAVSLRVPAQVRDAELRRIRVLLAGAVARTADLRTAALALARLALNLRPQRWHTDTWVFTDLERAGLPELRDLQAEVWAVRDADPASVRSALDAAQDVVGGGDAGVELTVALSAAVDTARESLDRGCSDEALYQLRLAVQQARGPASASRRGTADLPESLTGGLRAGRREALTAGLVSYARGLGSGTNV